MLILGDVKELKLENKDGEQNFCEVPKMGCSYSGFM